MLPKNYSRQFVLDALEGKRDGRFLGEPTRRRPVLLRPALPRRPAVRPPAVCPPAPTRPWYVWVLDSTGQGTRWAVDPRLTRGSTAALRKCSSDGRFHLGSYHCGVQHLWKFIICCYFVHRTKNDQAPNMKRKCFQNDLPNAENHRHH